MKVYKIRHNPTGLFYKPSKYGSKSNLSKNGKVYQRKPSLKHIGDVYHHPAKTDASVSRSYAGYETRKVKLDDWEIIEFEVV